MHTNIINLLSFISLSLTLIACSDSVAPQNTQNTQVSEMTEARQASEDLQKQLGARLKVALSQGGLKQGIEVCAQQAPQIAAKVSSQHAKTVTRTALHVRNPANSPNKEQEKVLNKFYQGIQKQKKPEELEHFTMLENGERLYMRPIIMQELCLACHGEISDELRAELAQYYPADQATGFKVGELRGAFVVRW